MIIKSVTLTNFMSYLQATFELDSVVSLVGNSDCGKTTVLTAIDLVLFNRDFPVSLIHDGKTNAKIQLEFADGRRLVRENQNGKSYISMYAADGTKLPDYKGKKGVEDYIYDFTKIRPVVLDPKENPESVNYIEAEAVPLFAKGTAETIQRRLSTLTGSGDLELARYKINQFKRGVNNDIKRLSEQIPALKQDLKTISAYVETFDRLMEQLKELEQSKIKLDLNQAYIKDSLESFRKTDLALKLAPKVLEFRSEYETFKSKQIKIQTKQTEINTKTKMLIDNITKIKNIKETVEKTHALVELLRQSALASPMPQKPMQKEKENKICPTCNRPFE